jgi:ATP-binding cassette, subfamily F, member 3
LTILETVNSVAVGDIRAKIREILGAFLFSGDDTDKKVKVLSGGERSRLSMALMLLQPFNLLVLDEPTNHLDMRSKDILKNALLEYDGTLIVVSHDREFLDGLVDKIYEFKNKKIKEHLGGIFEFLEKKKMDNLRELERNASLSNKKSDERKPAQDNKQIYLNKKEQDKKIRKAKNELEQAEMEILNLERRIAELEELMTRPEILSGGHVFKEYNDSKLKHDQLLVRWEKLHNIYENILQQKIV